MHTTLKPKTNIMLVVLWAAIAVLVAIFGSPTPWLFLLFGVVLGACTGFVQSLALREASRSLLAAQTVMEVRSALRSSRWGRRYLVMLWSCVSLLFVVAFYLSRSSAWPSLFAGYCAFAFGRELLTLRGTFELERLSMEQTA